MRRPGNLGNTTYWFGNTDQKAHQQSVVQQKLQEVTLANRKNHTPLSNGQRLNRIKSHLANPRGLMQKT